MSVNEKDFEDMQTNEQYVKFVAGKPKVLTISEVNKGMSEIKDKNTGAVKNVPAFICKVTNEDGEDVEKTYTLTSKKLTKLLMPMLLKNKPFKVSITQFGVSFDTSYEVKEL